MSDDLREQLAAITAREQERVAQEKVEERFLNGIDKILEPPPGELSHALLEYRDLLALTLPEREQHISWLRAGSINMIYGPRGIGKTMFKLSLTASCSTGGQLLRWPVSRPVGVLYVDGEMMLDELRTRCTSLLPDPPKAPLFFLTSDIVYNTMKRDLTLTSSDLREALSGILDVHPEIRVVIFDNISCLFSGLDEDKKRDWEPINSWLIKLRHRGLATILSHHAGKSGQQRGTSGREDALDTVIHLERPAGYSASEGCHFELKFTKARSVKGEEVGPLDVRLEELNGRLTWTYKPLEKSKEDEVRTLLEDGVESPSDIAEALGIDRSWAFRLKKKIQKGGGA